MTSHRHRARATVTALNEMRRLDALARAARKQERKSRMPPRPVKLKTAGIAAKTIVAGSLPLIAGVVLLLIDKLVPGADIDDTLWWTLLGVAPATGLGAYAAPAAPTVHARKGA